MAKVLFVNPKVREEDKARHVPYGVALLAAIAIRDGHQVQVFDHNAWRADDSVLKDVMQADDWDVVACGGLTTTYVSFQKVFEAARAYAPQAVTVAGGGILTSLPHEIMSFNPSIDIGVVGEAFSTFSEVLAAADDKATDYSSINGIIHRPGKGEIQLTQMRALLHDLDTLPYPAWELFPLEEVYFPNSSTILSERSMTAKRRLDINASYGCSLVCRFCFHLGIAGDMRYVEKPDGSTAVEFDQPRNYTRNIRYNSARYIVDMVHYMVDRFQVDFVSFLDENLMTMDQYSKRTWMDEICDLWIDEGLQPTPLRETGRDDLTNFTDDYKGVFWGGTSHATLCNPHILAKMGQAGCTYLDYGWESFSRRILKRLGKGSTPEANFRSYEWTMAAGIRPIPNQMIGFPEEAFDSIRDSMKAWQQIGISSRPFFVTAYPGSEWFSTYREQILEQYGGSLERYLLELGDATRITSTISENFTAVELYGLREIMMRNDYRLLDLFESAWRARNGDPMAGVRMAEDRFRRLAAA